MKVAEHLPKFHLHKKTHDDKSYLQNYRSFRKSGLKVRDSVFNALYTSLCARHVSKKKKTPDNLSEYPVFIRFLSTVPFKVRSFFAKIRKAFLHLGHKDSGTKIYNRRRDFFKYNYPIMIAVAVAFIGAIYLGMNFSRPVVLYAKINDTVVGKVGDQNEMQVIITELERNVTKILGAEFKFPYKVEYSFRSEFGAKASEKKDIADNLYSLLREYITNASGLYVDNYLVAVSEKREEIETALDKVLDSEEVSGDGEKCFFNEITIIEQAYPTKSISSSQKIEEILRTLLIPISERNSDSTNKVKTTTVQNSEKIFFNDEEKEITGISSDVDFHVKETNSYINSLQNFNDISLVVATKKNITYDEVIPHNVQYVEDSNLYTTMTVTQTKGVDGKRRVTADLYYVNGVEMKKKITSEVITKNPVTQVENVGIKVLPEEMGIFENSNRFILPYNGIVTSKFGWRDGKNHNGWDIGGKTGDKIYAGASGRVVTVIGRRINKTELAGKSYAGYGYVIVLDHGGGCYTLYAHLNDVAVYFGQEVKQGDFIGYLGNTGNSDGSHVHYEIMQGSKPVDPAKGYLYEGKYTIYDDHPRIKKVRT